MPDSWSSFTDTQADLQSLSDRFLQRRDQILVLVEKLDSKGFSKPLAEEVAKELFLVRESLTGFATGLLFNEELSAALKPIAARADHRSVQVLRFCLEHFAAYLEEIAGAGCDKPVVLLPAFNELSAFHKKPLLSESLLTVPDAFRVSVEALQMDADHIAEGGYLGFSQLMLGVYRGDNRSQKLIRLAESFEHLAEQNSDSKAKSFWCACSAFCRSVEIPAGELRPAVFRIFKEIESVLIFAVGDGQKPVLGMQQNVDRLLCNVLCYLYSGSDEGDHPELIEAEFHFETVLAELNQLHVSTPEPLSLWLQSSISVLAERLAHCAAILSEEALQGEDSVSDFLEEVATLKQLLIFIGVHGARENLDEVPDYLTRAVSGENMNASCTSLQLVEQQLLYQFPYLVDKSLVAETDETHADDPASDSVEEYSAATASDFGTRCNLCIDVIQQALDTALGSSGNLIPDSSVVNALTKLIDLVSERGIDELTGLLMPLSQVLTKAENSTLNQSETLLVQEAIIAATLGIDSLVGHKPMPDLISDVTNRVENVLASTSERLSAGAQRNSAHSGFLLEAEELLPRLFELFQRLRGAPDGASRLYGEINRLLHTLKRGADDAEEHDLASIVHYLESTMVDLTQSGASASSSFFDLAIESVECIGEDIEHLRNSEVAEDRGDLIDRLKLAGAVDEKPYAYKSGVTSYETLEPPAQQSATEITDERAGVVVLGGLASEPVGVDWSRRFQQVEARCESISSSLGQLQELTKELDQSFQTISQAEQREEQQSIDVTTDAVKKHLTLLKQVTEHQSTAVRQLRRELSSASTLPAAGLGDALIRAADDSARANNLRVQLKFEPGDVLLDRAVFKSLSAALAGLVHSIVAFAIQEPGERVAEQLAACATITVGVEQTANATVIRVSDDGCGVTVQGGEHRSDNPWSQVAKPDLHEKETFHQSAGPVAWSRQVDQRIDIAGLLNIATRYGGSVAIDGEESGSRYTLSLPGFTSVQNVLVFEVRNRQLAIPAADIESVGLADSLNALSLGHLLGLGKQSAFDNSSGSHCISCRTNSGLQQFLVDGVLGHQTLEFKAADRILPDIPGYKGVATAESGQLLLLLDMNYWAAQRN